MSPLLAQSGHPQMHCTCLLLGVKRTCRLHCEMFAYDPKRICTFIPRFSLPRFYAQSCLLVSPNDLPETLAGAQTCCSVVVLVSDARVRVVQKRAGEIRVLAAANSGGRGTGGAKQMRAYRHTHGREGAHSDYICHLFVGYRCAVVCGEPEG